MLILDTNHLSEIDLDTPNAVALGQDDFLPWKRGGVCEDYCTQIAGPTSLNFDVFRLGYAD